MTKPETKTVLGRVFTWDKRCQYWVCPLAQGGDLLLSLRSDFNSEHCLARAHGRTVRAATEIDAILALQATLHKMAELEVVE